jgi:hypothetical protein
MSFVSKREIRIRCDHCGREHQLAIHHDDDADCEFDREGCVPGGWEREIIHPTPEGLECGYEAFANHYCRVCIGRRDFWFKKFQAEQSGAAP